MDHPRWGEIYGLEEEALMSRVPESRRLRRLVVDLEHLVMREGFLHLSTDDIARRLRCSKATLYRLAPSREELFELVIERWLSRIRDARWEQVNTAQGWPDKLSGYLHVIKSYGKEASQRFMEDLHKFPSGYRILMDHQARTVDVVEAIIAGSVEAGDFQNVHPRLAADLILTSVRRVVDPEFLASVGLSMGDAADEWYRILEFGLIKIPGEMGRTREAFRKQDQDEEEGDDGSARLKKSGAALASGSLAKTGS